MRRKRSNLTPCEKSILRHLGAEGLARFHNGVKTGGAGAYNFTPWACWREASVASFVQALKVHWLAANERRPVNAAGWRERTKESLRRAAEYRLTAQELRQGGV